MGYHVNPDVPLLGFKDDYRNDTTDEEDNESGVSVYHAPRNLKRFQEAEVAGSEISYKCPDCRVCKKCKYHEHIEATSIKQEVEQNDIKKSVKVNTEKREANASLPLLGDPAIKLAPNSQKALKTYKQQLKILERNPEDKKAVIASEMKLQLLGYVAWVKDLPEDVQEELRRNPIQNFLSWRVVYKENSLTTPCRLVFDASQKTGSGYCLNDLVPKGINMLNKLTEMIIKWRVHLNAFHCDIQKMYNAIKLLPKYWCLQRYWFQEDLDPNIPPSEKIIMTIIYGVRSSGNQAQCALREVAEIFENEYPNVYEIIMKCAYMDDIMAGGHTPEESKKNQEDLNFVIGKAGFTNKGYTVTGQDPEEKLANKDGISINVGGMKWFSRVDWIGLDINEVLNFAKKSRGKKAVVVLLTDIINQLTKRHCAAKLGEIFDLSGLVTPLIAGMKVDLHELNVLKFDWDDVLPNEFQALWQTHFEMMQEIGKLRFERAVVPVDAVDLSATTLDFGDASKSLLCVAIYIRFKRKNGMFSCQLIFSRSRIIPEGMTQPRAELYAALVNTHSGEVVRRALGNLHQHALKFTDSQIVLYWICKNDQLLKEWVHNRIIEIHRFTELIQWFYVRSADMIADIGTRRCTSVSVVAPDSDWIQGYQWMKGEESDFPMMNVEQVTLSNAEV